MISSVGQLGLMVLGSQTAAQPTDFWGIVFPSYIAAVGGLISAVIGGVALFQSFQNKGSVRSIAAGLNEPRDAGAAGSRSVRTVQNPLGDPVAWAIEREGSDYLLVNRSATRTARVTRVTRVPDGRVGALRPSETFPIDVAPGTGIRFSVSRNLLSARVTAIRVDWIDAPGSASDGASTGGSAHSDVLFA